MTKIRCDRCEREFDAGAARTGDKVACPACGDINVVRTGGAGARAGVDPLVGGGHVNANAERTDRLGIPPDFGPEARAIRVRQAMFRARPILCALLWIVLVGGLVAGFVLFAAGGFVLLGAAGLAGLALVLWYIATLDEALEVTNKRVIWTRGLFSRSTSEVPHETIQNIQVKQSFWNRVWDVGTVGISSAGQSDVEIVFRHAPRPYRIREVIDAYRNTMN